MIGAVVLSPTRTRATCCFDVQRENIRADEVVAFLRRLRRKLRRPIIVVWDRWSAHRSAEKRTAKLSWKGIEFENLPAYCPELNPVEAMWSHAKYSDLANLLRHSVQPASNSSSEKWFAQIDVSRYFTCGLGSSGLA